MIISNSSPLILLAKMNKLELLKKLYREVSIPKEVHKEVILMGKQEGYADAFLIEKAINDFIVVKDLKEKHEEEATKLHKIIGSGETGAIILAIKEKADLLLIDNLEPRKIAETQNIKCRSTPGILLEAYKKGIISHEEYTNSIKLLSKIAWLSGDIVAHFLDQGYKLREDKENENK